MILCSPLQLTMVCSPLQLMCDITIHPFRAQSQSTPLGPNVLASTHLFLQSMWDRPPNPSPLGPASLLTHRFVSIPLRGTARRLAHRPVSGSNTNCNAPDPPLADIVLFGLSGFHTLINGGLFSSPTNVGHHNPPLRGPASSLALISSSNRCGTAPKSTPFGPSENTGTPPRVYPPPGNSEKADTSSGVWL